MPRAAKPTRLPGSGRLPSPTSEPDWFVKQGDFQALAAGRPMLFFRDLAKARVNWVDGGWRDLFEESFPPLVAPIDAALGVVPGADDPQDPAGGQPGSS
jgi:hypothetical protein